MVCRCDRTHENNDTATPIIIKNTSVFTVRLHIHIVEEARLKTKINMFYGVQRCKPSEIVSGPPQDLDLEAIWGSKTMPNPGQNPLAMKFNIALISGVEKRFEEGALTPGGGPSRTTQKPPAMRRIKHAPPALGHGGGSLSASAVRQ